MGRQKGDTSGSTARQSAKRQVSIIEGCLHLPDSSSPDVYLIGSKCRLCGYASFPKRRVCPSCVQEDTMEDIPLSRRGKIFSFTTAWVAPPGYETPYTQVWVDLPEGVRVFAVMSSSETTGSDIQIGAEVELITEKVGENESGDDVVAFKFRPVA